MDIIGAIGRQIGSKLFSSVLKTLSGLEPGKRYPHPQYGPIVVPRTPELKPGEPTPRHIPRFQITFPGFLALSGAIIWYAKSAMEPTPFGELPQEPEQKELFPQLRRELRMKPEDVAETDDPVEICLQRRYGWKLKRLRELRESIAEKSQPAIFKEAEEKLTRAEEELIDNIDDCLERIAAQYGSLEAAGIELEDCPLCGDDD